MYVSVVTQSSSPAGMSDDRFRGHKNSDDADRIGPDWIEPGTSRSLFERLISSWTSMPLRLPNPRPVLPRSRHQLGSPCRRARRNSQILLVFPRSRPKLAGPAPEGDRANRRTVFIPNDFSPGAGIRRANLRGTLAHAEQPLTGRSQARHSSPVLSTTRSTTHRQFTPARRVGIRAAESWFSA